VLSGANGGAATGHNHVHLEPDQLGRQVGELLGSPLRITGLQDEVLTLYIAELTEALPEGLDVEIGEGRASAQPPDLVPFSRRLYRGGERRRDEAEGEQDDKSNGLQVHSELLG